MSLSAESSSLQQRLKPTKRQRPSTAETDDGNSTAMKTFDMCNESELRIGFGKHHIHHHHSHSHFHSHSHSHSHPHAHLRRPSRSQPPSPPVSTHNATPFFSSFQQPANDRHNPSPTQAPPAHCPSDHLVQFYESDSHLYTVLADFFAPLLSSHASPRHAGHLGAVVLARSSTTAFLASLFVRAGYTPDVRTLAERNLDNSIFAQVGIAYRNGERTLLLMDADKILSKLVPDSTLVETEFHAMINELFSQVIPTLLPSSRPPSYPPPSRNKQPILAYGELVDVLCARGQHTLAVELEGHWNRFLSTASVSLLCGYRLSNFLTPDKTAVFEQICNTHTHVEPAETYSTLPTTSQKLAHIAALQQRALALGAGAASASAVRGEQHPHSVWESGAGDEETRLKQREQFIDTLCHELRNPVSGILGNLELLQLGLDLRTQILFQTPAPAAESLDMDTTNAGASTETDTTPTVSTNPPSSSSSSSSSSPFSSELRVPPHQQESIRRQLDQDALSIDAIAACANHMSHVADSVLSLSKLAEGCVVLERVGFSPVAVIGDAIKMFGAPAQKKGVRLRVDAAGDDAVRVVGDPGRFAQVVVNLVSNAVKFTEAGGEVLVRFRVLGDDAESSSSDNNQDRKQLTYRISVHDTGRGLSSAEIALLFRRFAQPVGTSFAKYGGCGLGLYISKYLVQLMGGELRVESERGRGSTFIFTVRGEAAPSDATSTEPSTSTRPAEEEHGNPVDQTNREGERSMDWRPPSADMTRNGSCSSSSDAWSGHSHSGTPSSSSSVAAGASGSFLPPGEHHQRHASPGPVATMGSPSSTSTVTNHPKEPPLHILLVDDNPVVLSTLSRLLTCQSLSASGPLLPVPHISKAENGYSAIASLISASTTTKPVDVVIMDLEMPFMNGVDATRQIRGLPQPMSGVPIIGLTGEGREEVLKGCGSVGMDEVVGKGIGRGELLGVVWRAVEKRWEGR